MFLRGLKSTQKSIHDTEAETEKEEEVRIKFFKTGSVLGHFWVWAEQSTKLGWDWVNNFCVGVNVGEQSKTQQAIVNRSYTILTWMSFSIHGLM